MGNSCTAKLSLHLHMVMTEKNEGKPLKSKNGTNFTNWSSRFGVGWGRQLYTENNLLYSHKQSFGMCGYGNHGPGDWKRTNVYRKQLADKLSHNSAKRNALDLTSFLEKIHYNIYHSGHPINCRSKFLSQPQSVACCYRFYTLAKSYAIGACETILEI